MKPKEFLDAVSGLIRLYEKLSQTDNDRFNVFTILRKPDDEVMLHSRFIYELLNPKGSHGMNQAYLSAFLDTVREFTGLPLFDWDTLRSTLVYREFENIDLLVYLPKGYTIIIENKIYAEDQDRQLERYFNTVKTKHSRNSEKIIILYLTLDGHYPSPESIGNLKLPIYNINYANEVIDWLNKCSELSKDRKGLYEVIMQYRKLVRVLTDTEEGDRALNDEIATLISNNKESFHAANAVKNALPVAQTMVLESLFSEFEVQTKQVLNIEPIHSTDSVKDYYTRKRGDSSPCLIFPLKSFTKEGNKFIFCFYICITHYLYYGFSFMVCTQNGIYEDVSRDEVKNSNPIIYSKCEKAVASLTDYVNSGDTTDSISLYWKYFYDGEGNNYNFKKFGDNCIDLYMDVKQEVKRMCLEVVPAIDEVKKKL